MTGLVDGFARRFYEVRDHNGNRALSGVFGFDLHPNDRVAAHYKFKKGATVKTFKAVVLYVTSPTHTPRVRPQTHRACVGNDAAA